MTDQEIVAWIRDELDVTRPELEHVAACGQCSITGDSDDPGPSFCHEFDVEFRGWKPREPSPEGSYIPAVWAQELRRTLERYLASGR